MEYLNNNLHKDYKNLLCIGTDILNVNKLPSIMKEYISDALINSEDIIFLTDNILYKDIQHNFNKYGNLISYNKSIGRFRIKAYDSATFNYNCKEFLDIIDIIGECKGKLKIVWDFKSFIKTPHKLEIAIKCIEKIIQYAGSGISNMVYIDNCIHKFNKLHAFSNLFEKLIIVDRSNEMEFTNRDEIKKAIWMLHSNSQLKYQNENLVLFNDIFANMPKCIDEKEFKEIIMSRMAAVCDIDFCILVSSIREDEISPVVDCCYGITKKHMSYLTNDNEVVKYFTRSNRIISNSNKHVLVNLSENHNPELLAKLTEIDVVSYVAIPVEYYDISKGVIWIGTYKNSREISSTNIEHLKSICKTAFYLIQEQKKFFDMQDKLIQNEKLRATGEMVAGITHDVNNILTPIVGSVRLLKETIKDKETLKLLNIIEICALDGINITSKVKKLTNTYNSEELEIFNIDNVVLDAIELTESKCLKEGISKGIDIRVIKNLKSNSIVQGNITEIREVFINIITNAVDAMPSGGIIEISTENKDDLIIIEIKDNGMGMVKEVQRRIFEPFFTTKGNNGSGLGLSISYNIILSHKGSMRVESEKGDGTSFIINLPIFKTIDNIRDDTEDYELNFKGNILVIDDQEQIRNVISSMIASITKCKIKSCGCDNLDSELKRRKYDIIICDLNMPGINGLQVAQRVKNINIETYFCLMTGWVGSFKNQIMNNVDFVLNKPISKESLKQLIISYNEVY